MMAFIEYQTPDDEDRILKIQFDIQHSKFGVRYSQEIYPLVLVRYFDMFKSFFF
jgi:hypothetical protein